MDVELELEAKRRLYPERRNGKKSSQQLLQERYEAGDLELGFLGDPSGKFDYYVLYPQKKQPPDALPLDDWGTNPSPKYRPPPPPTLQPYYQKGLALINKSQIYKSPRQPPREQPIECFMFTPESHQYKEHFPPLKEFKHLQLRVKHQWKIKNPLIKNVDGTNRNVSLTEAALN